MDRKKQFVMAYTYLIGWCILIFIFSSIPNLRIEGIGLWDYVFRKISHIIEFMVLTILLNRVLEIHQVRFRLFWAGLFALLYSMIDEYHQSFTEGRVGAVDDVYVDSIGVILGTIIKKVP